VGTLILYTCVCVGLDYSIVFVFFLNNIYVRTPLAGHEVSRIVSCVVAKHADETAYLGNLAPKTTKNPKTRNYQIAHHYLE
jgi:hypothetical protein